MQDKSNNGADDEEFSLNKFDVNDEEQQSKVVESDDFNTLISGNDAFDDPFEDDKRVPSISDTFASQQEALAADEMDSFSGDDYPAPVAEEPLIAADVDYLDDVFSEDKQPEPEQEESGSRVMSIFVVVAIVIIALVAWLNMGDDEEAISERHLSQPVLDEEIQVLRSEKKLLEMQQSLILLQERLAAKDEQIAELTHLVAEQSRTRQKSAIQKAASVIQKVRPVVKKTERKSVFEPIQSVKSVVNERSTGWVIVIASVATRSAADKALKGLKANGIHAEIHPTTVKGRAWYRIRISGFASRHAAAAQKEVLKKQHGIKDTWIHKPD